MSNPQKRDTQHTTSAMTANARLYFLVARTPIHVGCGDSLGAIDKPVRRHVVTTHPQVPNTAIKSRLRGAAKSDWAGGLCDKQLRALFGAEEGTGSAAGTGILSPQDANLLLLPVACWAGGAAWVTSPSVLLRLQRLVLGCQLTQPPPAVIPKLPNDVSAFVVPGSPLLSRYAHAQPAHYLVLHEEVLHAQVQTDWLPWAKWLREHAMAGEPKDWAEDFERRVALVPDAALDHLCEVATDVRTRNRIGADGIAEDNALWREECIPEDSVFAGVVSALRVPEHEALYTESQALAIVQTCEVQVGGRASIGCGWASFRPVLTPATPVATAEKVIADGTA